MSNDTTVQGVLFEGLTTKPVVVRFDQDHTSSDGGAILLKACDEALDLTARLAACLVDRRQEGKVQHTLIEMLRQRIYGLACGYEDVNDAARLKHDPSFKLLLERDPLSGAALPSQPTLCRFEQTARPRELLQLAYTLADTVIERHRRRTGGRVKHITIDLDPTVDPAHGQQQLSFFNSAYDNRCFLPLAGFLTFDDEPEQYLFGYVLRPGNASTKKGCISLLRRLLPRLRRAFPTACLRIRLDAGFAGSELFDFFEAEHLEYVVCMAQNSILLERAEPYMQPVRDHLAQHQEIICRYGETRYQARSWSRKRRVIIRASMVEHPGREPRDNARFIVTNIRGWPQYLYEQVYCARGDVENRIKELKDGLSIDRTSCSDFHANQLRVLMTAAAYILMQEIRLKARHTSCARAQVGTLRLRLFKIGTWVERSVRRIVLHLPTSMPYADDWWRIARAVGAVPT
jgi:hypothetical protein